MMKISQTNDVIRWAIIGWTFAITITRAIRAPNDFSEAHWLLDYRFGFIKRGLIGSLCNAVTALLGFQMNPGLIVTLSVLTLCSMTAAIFLLLYRASRRHEPNDDVFALGVVFASSPFVVMQAHLVGYFDALLYVFAIASVALTLFDRPFAAALVSIVAILSHESYLLIGFPLVCLASVAMLTASGKRARWITHIVALCLPLAAFLAIPVLQFLTTDAVTLRQQLTEHLDSFGFVPTRSRGVAEWQTTTFLQYLRQQVGDFDERLLNPVILASVGPPLLVLLVFIHASFRIRAFSLFSIMLLGVVCAPLALHAVAWDTERISIYSIGGAFIASWILAETRVTRSRAHDIILLAAVPTLVLNVFGRIPLMDGEIERFSDISRLLMYLPAIALLLTVAVKRVSPGWLTEFKEGWIPNNATDGAEE